MRSAAVAIPVYRTVPEKSEAASLARCVEVLGEKYPLILFAPGSLDISPYLAVAPQARCLRFDDSFFKSINGYSSLMLSTDFYDRFSDFDYMLLYQLDAWVFRDELEMWCGRNYDYIGAPFLIHWGKSSSVVVGNGGFSLRRIEAMKRVLTETGGRMFPPRLLLRFFKNHLENGDCLKALLQFVRLAGIGNDRKAFLERMRREGANEDVVFSYLNKRFVHNGLLMPDVPEAARFSLDGHCERFFELSGRRLPFGIHGWTRPDRMDFIKEHRIENGPPLSIRTPPRNRAGRPGRTPLPVFGGGPDAQEKN